MEQQDFLYRGVILIKYVFDFVLCSVFHNYFNTRGLQLCFEIQSEKIIEVMQSIYFLSRTQVTIAS